MFADALNQRELHIGRIRYCKTLFAVNGMQADGLIVEDREGHRAAIAYQVYAVLTSLLVSHETPGT